MPNTANLPCPKIYEKEYNYLPWGILIEQTIKWVVEYAPKNSVVLDYMCGTGYLLNKVKLQRKDLLLYGCSLDSEYIEYANSKYPDLNIIYHDALTYQPPMSPDIVICTAGLHHLTLNNQSLFIDKIALELSKGSYLILAEILIREHFDEKSRALAALELGTELINYCLCNDVPEEVTKAAFQVLYNDVFFVDEYKRSNQQILTMLQKYFVTEKIKHTWPHNTKEFGDFIFFCKRN